MPVEHYATVGKLVKLFTRNPMDPIYNRIISNKVLSDYPAQWWDEYDHHHVDIDRSLGFSWYNQVVPLCPDPDEVSGTSPQLVCGNILYDYINESGKVSKALSQEGITIYQISISGDNLENYFMSIVGGNI